MYTKPSILFKSYLNLWYYTTTWQRSWLLLSPNQFDDQKHIFLISLQPRRNHNYLNSVNYPKPLNKRYLWSYSWVLHAKFVELWIHTSLSPADIVQTVASVQIHLTTLSSAHGPLYISQMSVKQIRTRFLEGTPRRLKDPKIFCALKDNKWCTWKKESDLFTKITITTIFMEMLAGIITNRNPFGMWWSEQTMRRQKKF